ncbi:hypothetical protein AK812_SmicGene43847 [Symbiodinium microadriaticum]|uniref:3'-5' exonuclease domain-containing protein n=1 Tax=Symbiodinium microadriaticum TaxID=2951 RepID=A0A1Q9BZY7_SYMMI|nr:hypothetical protein AK812_SmicGene43847 [Symbiodinium microadriaticum]
MLFIICPADTLPLTKAQLVQTREEAEAVLPELLSQRVVGVDCEGVALGRWGRLCLCQAGTQVPTIAPSFQACTVVVQEAATQCGRRAHPKSGVAETEAMVNPDGSAPPKLEPTPPSTPPKRPMRRRLSWRSGLRGADIWREPEKAPKEVKEVQPISKELPPKLPRQAKHRQTLTDAAEYHEAAIKIQRHWRQRPPRRVALLRLINSEARRRHQKRPSFQMRAAVCEDIARDTANDPTLKRGPSIWQLMQCSTVIKEVLEDACVCG